MRKLLLLSALLIPTCTAEQWHGAGTQVGSHKGKPLYESTCDVQPNLVGSRGLSGKRPPLSAYYACEGQMKVTCPGGFQVLDTVKGRPEMRRDSFRNGPYTQVRTYWVQKTTVKYICRG